MYTIKTTVQKSPIEGKGYFADQDIPSGTIVYFYGESDIRVSSEQFLKLDKVTQDRLIEFAVEDEFGNWVETSSGPYTNHSCDPNIMPLFIGGQYVDVAIRDIKKGEEIKIDYAQFFSSKKWQMDCHCLSPNCRHTVGFGLPLSMTIEELWSAQMSKVIEKISYVIQPLYEMSDKYAIELTAKIKKTKSPLVAKYVKFSLVDEQE